MRVGADKVGFYLDQGVIDVHVNGSTAAPIADTLKLAGGGTIERRGSSLPMAGDAYTVDWPDGSHAWIDPLNPWGLRLYVQVAGVRAGQVSGLFGDFDGNATNDMVARGGAALPAVTTYQQLYRTYADSWRVSQAESLFDYGPGENTATFTDRTFPDQPARAMTLSDQATAACTRDGVTDPGLLADCAFDVDTTGSLAFAVNDADVQDTLHPVTVKASPAPVAAKSGIVTINGDGGSGALAFPGTAGERIYIGVTTTTLTEGCYITLDAPDGTSVASGCVEAGYGWIDTTLLTTSGTYRLVLKPPTGSGSGDVQVFTDINEVVPSPSAAPRP